jgi:hypothetical protein
MEAIVERVGEPDDPASHADPDADPEHDLNQPGSEEPLEVQVLFHRCLPFLRVESADVP